MSVCVCVRERETEIAREREWGRRREVEKDKVRLDHASQVTQKITSDCTFCVAEFGSLDLE